MAKQLNVNLAFTADTSQAKAQIKDLQNQLTNLINQPASRGMENGIASNIKEASNAAAELKVHLQNATNVKTGTLDFPKLSQSIQASGKSLTDYAQSLKNMGPEGQKAFMSLASAVAQAEVPIKRSNAMLKEFATTLKNTARWQISSSILHGFMGTLSSAYGYAQRLNESLNNIRIVTGYNADQMATFAEQANKAAKALSTTTTAYTDASLIYYQQGLKDTEVQERTDITVKMANVTGQSAQVVSDQLTAIWNNFNKSGEESYEKYADILTALGAATASSTDEIAGGLEKFASIADMIGLSYEYAASTLATITATTRQSEDVVGTALKTIFARIQGLSLGETLDDGTDLNKYSQALEKVGISIFDQAGELKNMDAILDEIGNKWKTLNKDQQVALAQTVAGVRQYNQLVSLFDNWDYFNENLEVAMTSTGELSKQAKIYEESWQAASNRVRAAMEGVFQQLLNDDFFIGVLNTIEKIVSAIDGLITSMGGFGGAVATVGAITTKVFSKQMAQGLRDMAYSLKMGTESGRKQVQEEKSKTIKDMADMMYDEDDNAKGRTGSELYQRQLLHQQQMIDNANQLTEAESRHLQILLDQEKALSDIAIKSAEQKDQKQSELDEVAIKLKRQGVGKLDEDGTVNSLAKLTTQLSDLRNVTKDANDLNKILRAAEQSGDDSAASIQKINQAIKKLYGPDTTKTISSFDQLEKAIKDSEEEMQKLRQRTIAMFGPESAELVDQYIRKVEELHAAEEKMAADRARVDASGTNVEEKMAKSVSNIDVKMDWADRIVAGADAVASTISVFQMLGSAIDTIKDPNMTGWEKFVAILTSLSMAVPMVVMTISSLKTAFGGLTINAISNTAAQLANAAATLLNAKAKDKLEKEAKESANALKTEEEALKDEIYEATTRTKKDDNDNKNSKLKNSFNDLKNSAQNFYRAYQTIIRGFVKGGAVIIAASAALAAASAYYHRFETAARKAGEAAAEANKAFSTTQGQYQEFTSAVEAYETAASGIEGLVYGTDEFREAVINANDEALKLIDTVEGLEYSIDDDGLIIIDQESLDKAKETQLEILAAAQATQIRAQQNKRNADIEVQKAQFMRGTMTGGPAYGKDMGAHVLGGAGVGAALGSAIGGPIGTAIGGAIGGAAALVMSKELKVASNNEERAIDALVEAYEEEGNSAFGHISDILANAGIKDADLLASTLNENISATQELITALYANAEATQQANEAVIDALFGEDIKESGLPETSQKNLTSKMGAEYDALVKKKYTEMFTGRLESDKYIQDLFAKQKGWTAKNLSGNMATYYDKNGQEVGTWTDEYARQQLAIAAAEEEISANLPGYIDTFKKVLETGNQIGEGIGDILTGINGYGGEGLNDLNKKQLSTLKGSISDYDSKTDSFKIGEQEITREMAKDLGFATANAYRSSILEEVDKSENVLKNAGKNLAKIPQEAFNDFIEKEATDTKKKLEGQDIFAGFDETPKVFESLSAEATQSLASTFGTVYENAGKEGLDYVTDFMSKLDDETARGLAEAMKDINWSDWDSVGTLAQKLRELNIEIKPELIDDFIDSMRDFNNSIKDLNVEDYRKTMDSILNFVKSLKPGDEIEPEEYQKLVDVLGDEIGSFFDIALGGTYKLIGGAEELLALAKGIMQAEMGDKATELNERHDKQLQMYNNLQKSSYTEEALSDSAFKGYSSSGKVLADKDQALTSLDYLEASGDNSTMSQAEIDNARELIKLGQAVESTYKDIAQAVKETSEANGGLANMISETYSELVSAESALALTAGSLDELLAMGLQTQEAYINGLQNLATQYDNCTEELNELIAAERSGDDARIVAAANNLESSVAAGQAAEAYDLEAEAIENIAQHMLDLAEAGNENYEILKEQPHLAAKAAANYLRQQRAIDDLSDSYADYVDILNTTKKNLATADKEQLKTNKTYQNFTKTLADLLGVEEDLVDIDLIKKINPKDLAGAAKGSAEAIQNMRKAYAEWIQETHNKTASPDMFITDEMVNKLNEVLAMTEDGAVLDLDTLPFLTNLGLAEIRTQEELAAMQSLLSGLGLNLEIAGYANTIAEAEALAAECNGVVAKNFTWKQNITGAEGETGTATYQEMEMEESFVPGDTFTTKSEVLLEGATDTATVTSTYNGARKKVSMNPVTETVTQTGSGMASSVETDGASGGTSPQIPVFTVSKAPSTGGTGGGRSSGGGSGGGGGGGGGGKSTPAKRPTRTHKREVWNPFRNTEKALDRIADALEDVEKRVDRLYGKNRIRAIEKVNEQLEEQIKKLKEQKVIAEDELKNDMAWLNKIAKENGLGDNAFTFKEEAQWAVSNYSDIMQPLWAELHGYQNEIQKMYETEGMTEEKIEEYKESVKYDDLEARISNIQDALGIYDESVEKLREIENAIADAFYEWQDNNYEKLHYTLELKVEVEEMDLKYIEYMLDKMSDDFWSMAEAAGQMVQSFEHYENILEANEGFYNDLNAAFMAGEISQADYVEGLKETYDSILDTLSAMNQLDKDMLEYYANALDAAADELGHYTDQLEHLTDVLDHYRNIIEMVNGEFAYDQIGTVLEAQSKTIKNELDVATQTYEMLQREKAAIEASLAAAGSDEAAAKVFQEELKAIEESLLDAHSTMLDKTEAWAEIELAIFENTMAKAARTMEMAMTDNMGFDSLSNSIDRLSSYADVYLTKTNQIYEMQTLINKATTESDKITNKAAQNRLQAFIKESEALKEKNKLSHLELEIQQAKYDLLLAEIALEEAKNAKSTVRLKRDSEGNFGYVYTADQEAIGEAEQGVLDAQNALYNIGLENANDYGEKLLQLRQEHADALIDLEERRAAGEFATDELYNAEKERINREYYALMEAYSEQYTIALGAHNAVQEDAWINTYEGMITETDKWQLAVTEYTTNCEIAFTTYQKTLKDGSDIIKKALDDTTKATKDVTKASDELAREIQSDLLPRMEDELRGVRAVTSAYAAQRAEILALIETYEALARAIAAQVRTQAEMDQTLDVKDYSYEMSKIIAEKGYEAAIKDETFKTYMNQRAEKIATQGTNQDWIESELLYKLFEAYDTNTEAKQYVDNIVAQNEYYNNEKAKQILGLATGGYTGVWGPDGRIALLHEKELVLNASDTSNFLKAIDIMREITKSIDLENLRQQYAFAINSIPTIGQGFAETIEQNVHIEASFPAVSDRNEIEEAFNNLINTASQFANRKKL